MMNLAPIGFLAYNRPNRTLRALEALAQNKLAKHSSLYIYVDGAKPLATSEDIQKIEQVKKVVRQKKWCKEVTIIEREENLGVNINATKVITELTDKFDKIIYIEDDLITSPDFLTFINKGLDLYQDEERVMHINGYVYPIKSLPNNFFIRSSYATGFGTWKRAWKFYSLYTREKISKKISTIDPDIFNKGKDGYFKPFNLLKDILVCDKPPHYDWDIRWYASIYLNDGLSFFPGQSLVRNIGYDGSGVHSGQLSPISEIILNQKIAKQVSIDNIPIQFSQDAFNKFIAFNKELKSLK